MSSLSIPKIPRKAHPVQLVSTERCESDV
jgi:hypothetical protein